MPVDVVSILMSAIVPVEIANARCLVPLPWLSVLILEVIYTTWDFVRKHAASIT